MANTTLTQTGAQVQSILDKADKLPATVGTNGQVLTSDGTNLSWQTQQSGGGGVTSIDNATGAITTSSPLYMNGKSLDIATETPISKSDGVLHFTPSGYTIDYTNSAVAHLLVFGGNVFTNDDTLFQYNYGFYTIVGYKMENCIFGMVIEGTNLQLTSGTAYYAEGSQVPLNTNLPLHKVFFFASDCTFVDKD